MKPCESRVKIAQQIGVLTELVSMGIKSAGRAEEDLSAHPKRFPCLNEFSHDAQLISKAVVRNRISEVTGFSDGTIHSINVLNGTIRDIRERVL
ncbi:MAG: hypothetical protein ACI8T1_001074 [Verrucomicrobiales bacterium]|jgi:hypothetical protein